MSEPTKEQQAILDNDKKNLIVSASAGSGKTFIVIEHIINLIVKKKVPVSRLLVLTFTKAAAGEMKNRLYKAILQQKNTPFLLEQLDDISISDISTIDAFCEKIIKRYVNKLNIDENFRVLDEKESKNLKYLTFNQVFDDFAENYQQFNEIYFAFKHDKNKIFECMNDLQSYFDSQDNGDELLKSYIDDYEKFYKDSLDYLNSVLKSIILRARENLKNINFLSLTGQLPDFYRAVEEICNINISEDFFENCNKINSITFPSVPRKKTDLIEEKQIITKSRDILKEMLNVTGDYLYLSEEDKQSLSAGSLAKGLLEMQKQFKIRYKELKGDDALDFADLEMLTRKLLENEDVLLNLQKSYDYIFIDEYQDTNTLQESIIKPIAEKGYFIAVGDPKQGIYGFRNASMEIMQRDIENFSNGEDSQSLFLTGNFRSDERLLSFVNKIFNRLMTLDSVGIDYEHKSQLKGLVPFEKPQLPAVNVDIIIDEEKENTKPNKIYSVKEDDINSTYEYKKEVYTLAHRIEEILKSQIYDAKQGKMRNVNAGDIAVLFRSRDKVMKECTRFLQEKGFSVFADLKQELLEDSELQIITSLIRLSLNFKDDISLVSVLASWFGGLTLDELSELRLKYPKVNYWEIADDVDSEKIKNFKEKLTSFQFDCQTIGLTKALNKLFNQTNYYVYLDSLPDKNSKKYHLQEFFKLISQNNFDYNLPGLVGYLDNIDTSSSVATNAVNAITLTTIHATKGLEYPVVILAGAGEKLSKNYIKSYIVSSKFGMGTYLYNYQDNLRLVSPPFLAGKYYKKRREFVDELMIFYVALTRGQNHLYLIGTTTNENLKQDKELFKCDSYLDLILYSLGENFKDQLLSQEKVSTENWQFNLINEVEDAGNYKETELENFNRTLQLNLDTIRDYINLAYAENELCKINYKNSVSGILNLENDTVPSYEYNGDSLARQKAIERGNAFHQALKFIDFNKVDSPATLHNLLLEVKDYLEDGYFDLIDEDILFKDIQILKKTVSDNVYKEREFIMQLPLKEVLNIDSDKEVIIQGIIDLFSLGEKNILIDYKFSSIKDEERLLKHYKKQLDLYAIAVEKAFDIKLDEIYLLSLANAKLIKYDRNN